MRRDSVGKMKTLDEVIKANECCDHGEPDSICEDCPYNGIGACCAERESDALQWLKGYRAHIELDKLRDKCETENDPLTWDELRTMGGKPVWYEHEFWKGWIILGKVEQGINCEMIPDREEKWYIAKDGSAKAYRKER